MSIGLPICPLIFLSLSDESDRQFLEQLYIKYHRVMIRMAQSLCSSKADAEDIVSESLIALACKISVIRDLECSVLEGYVISVVKHTAYAHGRKRMSRREVRLYGDLPDPDSFDAPVPGGKPLNEYPLELLKRSIAALKEEDRALIFMRYYEKRSCREIAEALGLQESHVRTKLTRIRRRLLRMISEAENDEKDEN